MKPADAVTVGIAAIARRAATSVRAPVAPADPVAVVIAAAHVRAAVVDVPLVAPVGVPAVQDRPDCSGIATAVAVAVVAARVAKSPAIHCRWLK